MMHLIYLSIIFKIICVLLWILLLSAVDFLTTTCMGTPNVNQLFSEMGQLCKKG